ncbi:unnamed protein product [Caenorhabditis angaria]|uniref:Uncharacterized protein n=1 Tax=Caenorhabditis angaria TaxID=860376 RepID=A0A9P1IGX2_9PELO|nr:unnamed protein product [Caenorhabditis angaria]
MLSVPLVITLITNLFYSSKNLNQDQIRHIAWNLLNQAEEFYLTQNKIGFGNLLAEDMIFDYCGTIHNKSENIQNMPTEISSWTAHFINGTFDGKNLVYYIEQRKFCPIVKHNLTIPYIHKAKRLKSGKFLWTFKKILITCEN